jgi:hypothetical protein
VELFFGRDAGFASAPDMVISSTFLDLDLRAVPAGDFNGDGLSDFAVLDPDWNDYEGRVSLYFGRARGEWPSTLDISGGCEADLCLQHAEAFAYIGDSGAALDFDGDGKDDLAIGNSWFPADYDGQLVIVKGDSYEVRSCTSDGDCRAQESCVGAPAGVCELDPGEVFWRLTLEVPSGDYVGTLPPGASNPLLSGFVLDAALASGGGLGTAMVALGEYDGTVGDDLAVSAPYLGEVHFLSGRAHSGTPGFDALDESDLGLRNGVDGPTDGLPIATGNAGPAYGYVLGALGSFYDPATGAVDSGRLDLAASGVNTDDLRVIAGERASAPDRGFSAAERTVLGANTNVGESIASSYQPALGLLGDLDGDGEPELCAGSRLTDRVYLFYKDTFAAAASTATVNVSAGLSFTLATNTPESTVLIVQYVGDLNGDGHLDLVVGDPAANGNVGQVVVLY